MSLYTLILIQYLHRSTFFNKPKQRTFKTAGAHPRKQPLNPPLISTITPRVEKKTILKTNNDEDT